MDRHLKVALLKQFCEQLDIGQNLFVELKDGSIDLFNPDEAYAIYFGNGRSYIRRVNHVEMLFNESILIFNSNYDTLKYLEYKDDSRRVEKMYVKKDNFIKSNEYSLITKILINRLKKEIENKK